MHLDGLIVDLAVILVVAAIVTILFKKLKQPLVMGYIVAGFLISPNLTLGPTFVPGEDIAALADIGAIFLMFGLGLEFSFKKIAKIGGSAFTIAATVMVSMILVGAGVGHLMGWDKMDCIFLGGMISMSSTMIILKAYEEYNLKEERFAQIVLGTLVIEDIAGIFMLIVLSTISVGKNISGTVLISELGIMLLYLAIWLMLGIFIIPTALNRVSKLINEEMLLILAVGLCLLMVVIANAIGFSSALGAFLAGSILAGTVHGEKIELMVDPIKNLFGAIFFVSVGMMIQPDLLVKYIVQIIILSVVVMVGQMLFSTLGIVLSGQSLYTALRGGFSMVQIGEFSFIVASLGMTLGVISNFLYPIIICVSVVTSFATPFFIKGSERVYTILDRKMPEKLRSAIRKNTSDNQFANSMDSDWIKYIHSVLLRTSICSMVLFIIYFLGTRYVQGYLYSFAGADWVSKGLFIAVEAILMAPFVNLMHGTNNALRVKLWLKHRSNRLPIITLKALRILIAACFVALVVRDVFRVPFVVIVLLSSIPIVFVARSDWMNGVTIDMEKRFAANLSEKLLAKQKRDRKIASDRNWLDKSLFVVNFQITGKNYSKKIIDMTDNIAFIVTIIRIIREDDCINMPSAEEEVKYGDILQMMGTKDEIEACILLLERSEAIEAVDHKYIVLKDFIYGQRFKGLTEEQELLCIPVLVKGNNKLVFKSIRNSNLRRAYHANLVGIERGNLTMVSPDIDTVIRKNDIIWLMGDREMVDSLIQNDLV